METGLLNACDYGVVPGAGSAGCNTIALQHVVNDLEAAGGGTVFIPAGVYEFGPAVSVAVSAAGNAAGTIRITGEDRTTLVQVDESNLFFVTEAEEANGVGQVVFEGLGFQGSAAGEGL